jgi:ElaB/YqjD/DUF883 family membrane-anchored ribosome-binding protein
MDETARRINEQIEQVQGVYDNGRRAVGDLARSASDKSKQALTATDHWVHDNPWVALGVVAGVGLVLGVLMGQSFRESD